MVTICGTGFDGVTDVKFGGVSAIWFSGDSSTQVRAQSAGGAAGTVNVTVITPNGTSAISPADEFTYVADPVVIVATTTPVPTSTQDTSGDSDDTPGGTNVQGQAVAVAQPAATSSVDVNVGGDSAVSQVTVTGSGVGGMIVTGTVQSGPGPGMPAAPGEVYQYLRLVPARYSTITGAEIVFSVPESWFAEHTLSPRCDRPEPLCQLAVEHSPDQDPENGERPRLFLLGQPGVLLLCHHRDLPELGGQWI